MLDSDLARKIAAAQQGDQTAENEIAEFLLPLALRTAQQKFATLPSPMVDEDDLANSALGSMMRGLGDGRIKYDGLVELQALLKKVVNRKARKYWRREHADKRGKGTTKREADFVASNSSDPFEIAGQATVDPEQHFVADESLIIRPDDESSVIRKIVEDLQLDLVGIFKTLMNRLDDRPRAVLLLLMQRSCSNTELASKLNCAVASVERYRAAIKRELKCIVSNGNDE